LNFENISLRHLKVPCDYQDPPENRIKSLSIIEEVIVVSLGHKKKIHIVKTTINSLPHSKSKIFRIIQDYCLKNMGSN